MRLSIFGPVFLLLAACSSPQEPSVAVDAVAKEPALINAAEPAEPEAENPDVDPVADGEWAPIPDAIAPDAAEPAIDLEMGDGYNSVKVNGRAPREEPKELTCKTAKDCKGMSRPKMPGEIKCIERRCVFQGRKRDPKDTIELF